MSPPSKQALGLLEEILSRLPWERPALLESRCGGDAELRQQVESLLAHEEAAGDFLERPLFGVPDRGAGTGAGAVVGSYALVAKLGEGGAGEVFLGRRLDPQLEQEVAVKVLRGAVADESSRSRLLRERQILAGLSHPSIARLIDGGTTGTGNPYFVMELVEGLPITRYCDTRCLPLGRRVELFLSLCEAVRYAHQHLIVHRDLKPENILVGDDGLPKVLDFGIAKILPPSSADDRTHTVDRSFTPAYASPEQVLGEPISTATDTFSLGVLLFELLTGALPFPHRDISPEEWARRLREAVPPRASRSMERQDAATAAAVRGATPKQLAGQLRGDLDTILAKALAADSADRYASVADLADDLRRWRAGLPILARPASPGYVAGKWLRRNAWPAAAAALVLAGLVGVAVVSTVQSRRLEEQRSIAQRAQSEEELHRRRAERVVRFLVETLADRDPRQGRGELTLVDMLDLGVRRASRELDGDPALHAELLQTFGAVYHGVGLLDRAAALTERSLELHRRLDPQSDQTVDSLRQLAAVRADGADLDGAMASLWDAFRRRAAVGGPTVALRRAAALLPEPVAGAGPAVPPLWSPAAALVPSRGPDLALLATTGAILRTAGRLEEAREVLELALQTAREGTRDPDLQVAERLTDLATLQGDLGRTEDAESTFREALRQYKSVVPGAHPAAAAARTNLSLVLIQSGRFGEAEQVARRASEEYEEVYGPRHYLFALSLNNLAQTLEGLDRLDEAEELHRQALDIEVAALGPRHPSVGTQWNNLAIVWQRQGRLEDAERAFRASLAIRREALGREHPHSTQTALNLANLLRRGGRLSEARQLTVEAAEILARLHGTGHPEYARAINGLVFQDLEEGRYPEAAELGRQVVAAYRSELGESSWRTAVAEARLGVALAGRGEHREARELLTRSAALLAAHDLGHHLEEIEGQLRRVAQRRGVAAGPLLAWLQPGPGTGPAP